MKSANIDLALLRQTIRVATLQRRRALLQRLWDERFDEIYASGRFLKLCNAIDRCEEALRGAEFSGASLRAPR